MIETLSKSLSVIDRGNQLIHVVRDYLEDGQNDEAIRVLGQIDTEYFEIHMYEEASKHSLLADSIADIIEILGLGFSVLARPRSYLC